MSSDEREIFTFLKTLGGVYVTANEICRRAGGKMRFHREPHWAKPILVNMVERGILEMDIAGRFHIKPVQHKKRASKWIAPEIAKILEESGVKPDAAEGESQIASDEYYDEL